MGSVARRGTSYLWDVTLAAALLVYPATAKQIISRRPTLVASLIWVASWVLPWFLLFRRELAHHEDIFFFYLCLGPVALASVATLTVFSALLCVRVKARYKFSHVYAVLGYTAVPHLVVASLLTVAPTEAFGVVPLTGLPGGLGLVGIGVLELWEGLIKVGATWLWYVPSALIFWSGFLSVIALRYMSKMSWVRASATYGALVAVSAVGWGILGLMLSVMLFALALARSE